MCNIGGRGRGNGAHVLSIAKAKINTYVAERDRKERRKLKPVVFNIIYLATYLYVCSLKFTKFFLDPFS